MAKTEEEKAEAKRLAAEAEAKRIADEKEEAELKAESDRVEAERLAKAEELKKSRAAAQGTENQNKMYSEEQVKAMLKQFALELKNKDTDVEGLDEEDVYKQKKVRIPRFKGKFIYSFKNTNTDEYFPDLVIHAFDVWNDQKKQNEAWVTVMFEDNTTLSLPLYTVLTKSQTVWVDLVEVIQKDTSYSAGKTERAEVKDYSRQGTGVMVKMKITQADYSYKIKLPNDGPEVIVGKECINW